MEDRDEIDRFNISHWGGDASSVVDKVGDVIIGDQLLMVGVKCHHLG